MDNHITVEAPELKPTALSIATDALAHAEEGWKATIKDFQDNAVNPLHVLDTMEWKGEAAMIASALLGMSYRINRAFKARPVEAKAIIEEAIQDAQRALIENRPWRHNSTSLMSNLKNQCVAEALVKWVEKLQIITTQIERVARAEAEAQIVADYSVVAQLDGLPDREFARILFEVAGAVTKKHQVDAKPHRTPVRKFIVEQAGKGVRYSTLSEAIHAYDTQPSN